MSSNVRTEKGTIVAYATALWLACTLVASNAHADDQLRSETVKFADLNLSTQTGAEALYRRIHAAAWRVCDEPGDVFADVSRCVEKAESQAIGKVNAPLLTAYYQKKTGGRPQALTASR